MTNEREVIKTKAKIAELKKELMNALQAYIATSCKSDAAAEKAALDVQAKANSYFNFVEEFVGNSDLLGAHKSDRWAQGFAEDCLAILESMPEHYRFLEIAFHKIPNLKSIDFLPNTTAFANMQRMVAEYLSNEVVEKTRKSFLNARLPVYGFENPIIKHASFFKEKIISCVVGGILLTTALILTFTFTEPSPFQEFVIWATLAMGLAGVAAIIPGFIQVDWRKRFGIAAGGALAVFVAVYFFKPSQAPRATTNHTISSFYVASLQATMSASNN